MLLLIYLICGIARWYKEFLFKCTAKWPSYDRHTHIVHSKLLPSIWIGCGITEQFDKSGFDKLIQLLKLLLVHSDNIINAIHPFASRNLFIYPGLYHFTARHKVIYFQIMQPCCFILKCSCSTSMVIRKE